MLVNDNVKISLTEQGYLMNYPYHLISKAEMCKAFMDNTTAIPGFPTSVGSGMFFDYYPFQEWGSFMATHVEDYRQLVLSIQCHILTYVLTEGETNPMPDWVYSYMLGSVISVNSDKRDIHDLILPLGVDNIDDDFDAKCEQACFTTSQEWIKRNHEAEYVSLESSIATTALSYLGQCNVYGVDLQSVYNANKYHNGGVPAFLNRPPTMFGEPHVVKSVRLQQMKMGR